MSERDIEGLAMRWIEARTERERLRDERNAILCAHERMVTHREEYDARLHRDSPPPTWEYREGDACWRGKYEATDNEGGVAWVYNRELEEWCDPCLRRKAIHESLRLAVQVQRARMAALTRGCRVTLAARNSKASALDSSVLSRHAPKGDAP